ncbi:hypothetical protein KUH03_06400 [Sphingobacterium sp. E70]|uniref:hypothetical protein n=1 Tax=Sphingobacterium sp. E70 TaxID=2853439 RepID=UPI00211D0765|nr:hypothetical protein [Sphingobacterium sp. E70]ULT26492.1 hypothetical protein KUH03_06400 [Sphingobacterium sp. E70]
MKRLLFAALIGTAALVSFSSCTKEYITQEAINPGRSFIYTVKPNEWSSDNNKRIIHKINLPELTKYYIDQGNVSVHMSLKKKLHTKYYRLRLHSMMAEKPIPSASILTIKSEKFQ